MQYSEPVVIQTRSQSCNEINTHTEHLVQKHSNFLQLKRSYLVLNNEKRKQGNKKEKLTESLHLTVKPRRLNDRMTLVSETSHEQIVTSHMITFRMLAVQTLNGTTSERATNG